jgi:hypothetical protein
MNKILIIFFYYEKYFYLKIILRCMKEIKLDKHIKLLDCPGIVMSKEEDPASLALKNCIKVNS